MKSVHKFALQDNQYARPYHHFVSFQDGDERFFDSLKWGLEYYGYISFIIERVKKIEFNNIAEVGCGDGKILYELSKQYSSKNFEGYDLSEKSIAFAKAYSYGFPNLSFYSKDFAEAEKQFDLILCVETLEHIPDEEVSDFLEVISKNMLPDAKLLLSVPSTNLKLHKKHYRHYDLPLLEDQTKKYFEIEKHWFVHNPHPTGSWFIRFLLYNRFFITNLPFLRKLLFKQYRKYYRLAPPNKGLHLIAVLTKKSRV